MKKKNWLILLLSVILIACQGAGESQVYPVEAETINNEPEVEVRLNGDSLENKIQLPDEIPHIISRGDVPWLPDSIVLIDLLTGDDIVTLNLADDVITIDVFDFNDGYFGALVGNYDSVLTHSFINGRFLILDEQLNVLQDLSLTSESFQNHFERVAIHVSYQNDELIIYHAPNYLFHTENLSSIYRYNVHTGIEERLVDLDLNNQIVIHELLPIGESLIAFMGGRLGNEESLMYHGIVDLETGRVSYYTEPAFRASRLMGSSVHIVISEELDLSGRMRESYQSLNRNEIILTNTQTMQRNFISLDEMESGHVRLLQDGRFFVTITADHSRFRKYEIIDSASALLIQEVAISLDDVFGQIEIFPITETLFIIHQREFHPDRPLTIEIVRLP